MNIANRIKRFITASSLNLSTFDKSIGVANGYIGKQIKSKGSVGSHIIEKIISTYPNLNVYWLMTGEGDMFCSPRAAIEKNKTICYEKESKSDTEDITLINMDKETADLMVKTFELYDTSLRMGNEINLLEEVNSDADSLRASSDFTCVRYKGDGMSPIINHNTYMVSRKINKQDWSASEDNCIYIVSCAKDVFIGRLVNRFDEGYILLLKNSLDKEKYPDVRINVLEVESMWSVKGYMLSQEQSVYQPKDLSSPISTIEENLKKILEEVGKIKNELHAAKTF